MIESLDQLPKRLGSALAKNTNPKFSVSEDKRCLPFNLKMMKAAEGFISSFTFATHVAYARSNGTRKRMPPPSRMKALEALLQGMCFHYDPLANRVSVTMTTLAIECGLATESQNGNVSISRATRAMEFLKLIGLIEYESTFNSELGCNNPSDVMFLPAFFEAIEISETSLNAARNSRAAWANKKRAKLGLALLSLEELASEAWRAFRDRFYAYRLKRKKHGEQRARGRRDAARTHAEITVLVKQQLTNEIIKGKFPKSLTLVSQEVRKRVRDRMILSRAFTRLDAGHPGLS